MSPTVDYAKMKVTELRKELKSRGLPSTGDKNELITRLQAAAASAASDEGEVEYNLDTDDEIDDLGDDAGADICLDDTNVNDALNEDLSVAEEKKEEPKPKTLKRKSSETDKKPENGDAKGGKKIVLHRPVSTPGDASTEKPIITEASSSSNAPAAAKITTATSNVTSKLEARAKRFGLPMSEEERKEARKIRFGMTGTQGATKSDVKFTVTDTSADKLKKRAERFGQSVAPVLKTVEEQERLERRRARFGLVK